jgi:hypothetical protein
VVNLILAILWLGFGGWLLTLRYAWQQQQVQLRFFVIDTSLIGWLALVLAAYNLVRWYSQWQAERTNRLGEPLHPPRHHHEEEPTNPDFDFSKPPQQGPDNGPPPA